MIILLVLENRDHCVVTFTLDGHYVGRFGTEGSGDGQLYYPIALATDYNDFILVADTNNCRAVIFYNSGNYINCFGSKESDAGQFSNYSRHSCKS